MLTWATCWTFKFWWYETEPWMTLMWHQCKQWISNIMPSSDFTEHVNSMWPSAAIWQQRSWSRLAQVMAWCLIAPSRYMNQCWLFINNDKLYVGNFRRDTSAINHFFKLHSNFPGVNESRTGEVFMHQWTQVIIGSGHSLLLVLCHDITRNNAELLLIAPRNKLQQNKTQNKIEKNLLQKCIYI